MKIAVIFCITIGVNGDLIGFNRLGNNVQGHYQTRILQKTRSSSYFKQLEDFMISRETVNFQSTKIRELTRVEKAAKRKWNSKRFRNELYHAYMTSK